MSMLAMGFLNEQGQQALAAACAELLGRDPPDLRVIRRGAGPLHMLIQHPPDPAIGDAGEAGHEKRRHFPAQGDTERLHRQREAGVLAAPRCVDSLRLVEMTLRQLPLSANQVVIEDP